MTFWARSVSKTSALVTVFEAKAKRSKGTPLRKSLLGLMPSILGTAKPQIDGLPDFCGEWHLYFSPFARRCVAGVQSFHYHQSVFSGCLRRFPAAHATREVCHLLGKAIVP